MSENIDDSSSSDDEAIIDEADLNKFTSTLDQFTPVIPETVTKFYMRQCGLQADDDRVVKLMSLSVQKFMTDIINDCYQLHKIREKASNRQATATVATSTANAQPSTTETTANATTTATAAATTTTTDPSANTASGKKPVPTTNQALTLNDLTHVLGEYGINVKKTFYYT